MIHQLPDDIALELAMLETAFPPAADLARNLIDLRGESASVLERAKSSLVVGVRTSLVEGAFLPLLFGAAWKVFDIIVERGLQAQDPKQVRPPIATKVKRAMDTGGVDFAPLMQRADVAATIAELYAKTHDLRHSVVHRRIDRDQNGDLLDINGSRMSKADAIAFCELALIVGRCATMPAHRRIQSHAAWLLNLLVGVHGAPLLPDAHEPRPMDVVLVAAVRDGERWVVNTERAHQRVTDQGYPFAWLEVHPPGGEFAIVRTPLHEAPRGVAVGYIPDERQSWA